jgi:hypothetical protein
VGKILLVIVVFAAIVYTLFWLVERRRAKRAPRPSTPGPTPYRRAVGPDDDEEFLRQLEQQRRRAARDRKNGQPDKNEPRQDKPGSD